jgi:hypothetical protein
MPYESEIVELSVWPLQDGGHAHLAYRLINDTKPGAPWRALQDVADAADCFIHAAFEHPADVRGVSPFLAASNLMIDLQEIDMAVIEQSRAASASTSKAPLAVPMGNLRLWTARGGRPCSDRIVPHLPEPRPMRRRFRVTWR